MKRFKASLAKIDPSDVFLVAGLGLLVAGVYTYEPRATLIAGGLAFCLLAWLQSAEDSH